MPVEVIGIDHIHIAVRALGRAEAFYDRLMEILGFRKSTERLDGDPHVHYYNRHFGFTIRPARIGSHDLDRLAPGLNHFCFRVDRNEDVDRAARALAAAGIETTVPKPWPQYDPDCYAFFLSDPDGIRLEITNYRRRRRERSSNWNAQDS